MSKMCPSCGSTLDDNQKFCSVCGQSVASVPVQPAQPVETATTPTAQPTVNVCPKCGVTNAPGTKFCISCGFNFAPQPEVPQQPQQPQPPQQFQQPQQPTYQQPQLFQQPQQPAYQQPQPFQKPQQPAYQQPQPFQQNQMPAPKKSSTGMIVAIILIAVIVIGCAIAGIWFMTRDKDDDDSSDKKSSSVISSREEDSSEEDSSEESSEIDKPSNENDLDEYGIFTTSKSNKGYQIPVAQMMYGVQINSYDEFIDAYPDFVGKYYDTKYDTTEKKNAFIDDIYQKYVTAMGEGFKINCETTSESTYSTSLAESYCKSIYKSDVKVEEAYRVYFKVIISNNGESRSTTSNIRCFKIDGKWYVFE